MSRKHEQNQQTAKPVPKPDQTVSQTMRKDAGSAGASGGRSANQVSSTFSNKEKHS